MLSQKSPPCGATTLTNMEKEVCQRNLNQMVVIELIQRFLYSDGSVPFPMRCETQVAYIVLEQNLGTDLESGQSSWLQQGILQKN